MRVLSEACDEAGKEGISCELVDLRYILIGCERELVLGEHPFWWPNRLRLVSIAADDMHVFAKHLRVTTRQC